MEKPAISYKKTKNRKCSVEGCNEKHSGLGFCKSHYTKFRRENDPEYREKYRKKSMDGYFKFHKKRKQAKNKKGKSDRIELYQKLGATCISCGEKLNLNLRISNLHIHHKFYDEEDIKARAKFNSKATYGNILKKLTSADKLKRKQIAHQWAYGKK